jgi:hypothetical protein
MGRQFDSKGMGGWQIFKRPEIFFQAILFILKLREDKIRIFNIF